MSISPKARNWLLLLAVFAFVLIYACSYFSRAQEAADTIEDTLLTKCEQAVRNASDVDDFEDTAEDLDPAIRECESFADFRTATRNFPEALDGADARMFASNRCQYNSALSSTSVCLELGR